MNWAKTAIDIQGITFPLSSCSDIFTQDMIFRMLQGNGITLYLLGSYRNLQPRYSRLWQGTKTMEMSLISLAFLLKNVIIP